MHAARLYESARPRIANILKIVCGKTGPVPLRLYVPLVAGIITKMILTSQ